MSEDEVRVVANSVDTLQVVQVADSLLLQFFIGPSLLGVVGERLPLCFEIGVEASVAGLAETIELVNELAVLVVLVAGRCEEVVLFA